MVIAGSLVPSSAPLPPRAPSLREPRPRRPEPRNEALDLEAWRSRLCVFAACVPSALAAPATPRGGRLWTVACGPLQVGALARDRNVLWAEAVALYHAGVSW